MKRAAMPTLLVLAWAFSTCGQSNSSAPSNVPAQTAGSGKTAGSALNLTSDTAILAKLVSPFDIRTCKIGDHLEAQITDDVKEGRQTVIKKSSRVIGQISIIQTAPAPGGLQGVGIVFENIALKNSEPVSLLLVIQALAPPVSRGIDTISDPRGREATDLNATVTGHLSATERGVDPVTAKSQGVIDLPDINLAFEAAHGTYISIVRSKGRNIHLEKGTQIVFRVVNP